MSVWTSIASVVTQAISGGADQERDQRIREHEHRLRALLSESQAGNRQIHDQATQMEAALREAGRPRHD